MQFGEAGPLQYRQILHELQPAGASNEARFQLLQKRLEPAAAIPDSEQLHQTAVDAIGVTEQNTSAAGKAGPQAAAQFPSETSLQSDDDIEPTTNYRARVMKQDLGTAEHHVTDRALSSSKQDALQASKRRKTSKPQHFDQQQKRRSLDGNSTGAAPLKKQLFQGRWQICLPECPKCSSSSSLVAVPR